MIVDKAVRVWVDNKLADGVADVCLPYNRRDPVIVLVMGKSDVLQAAAATSTKATVALDIPNSATSYARKTIKAKVGTGSPFTLMGGHEATKFILSDHGESFEPGDCLRDASG